MPLRSLKVNKFDLEQLRESGLTDATIRRNELITEGGALVAPLRNLQGETNGVKCKKPHCPRKNKNGKVIKYEWPDGEPLQAYYPAECIEKLRSSKGDIDITEGFKKALRLAQAGRTAIGLNGVYCWTSGGTGKMIPGLLEIAWSGRRVNLVYDYDEKEKTRRYVNTAECRFAKELREAGASEVFSVKIPPGADGEKQGIDDFIHANGERAYLDLVEEAEPVPDCCTPMRIPSGRTDAANALRLVTKFVNVARWVSSWDKWIIWDGQRWQIDPSLRIQAFAKTIAANLWKEISAEVAKGDLDRDTISAMVTFAKTSNSANSIRNMVALARSEPGVSISLEELDTDPMLLNVQNGTIDLQSGDLREHSREDFITKLAPVTFDADVDCPRWRKFLKTIFDDNEKLIDYVQRLIGYCLTGSTEEHILPFLFGIGANGKSTFVEALMKLLGPDYSMKAPPDLLMVKRGESHPTDRADLFGKRLVACVETEDGRRMAEALVKELTGGDRVRARRMREDFWEFTPTHHVWLAGNHKPTITGTDHGIWRRIKLIPFDVVIPDAEQDKKLGTTLSTELPGILNWAVEGCLDWQKDGMQEPEIVQVATKEYSNEMDDVGLFIDERCVLGQEFMAPATELYQEFLQVMPGCRMSQKSFGQALRRRGFEKGRITKGANKARHGWHGLSLRTDADREQAHTMTQDFLNKVKINKRGK